MTFEVVDLKALAPDITTTPGLAQAVSAKLISLLVHVDPALTIVDRPSDREITETLREIIVLAQQLAGRLTVLDVRVQRVLRQEAKGGLPWSAIRAVMIERGFTHVRTMGGSQPLANWEPYGNNIPNYYRAVLRPDLGPGWFSDCVTDDDMPKGDFSNGAPAPLYYLAGECVTIPEHHKEEPS